MDNECEKSKEGYVPLIFNYKGKIYIIDNKYILYCKS